MGGWRWVQPYTTLHYNIDNIDISCVTSVWRCTISECAHLLQGGGLSLACLSLRRTCTSLHMAINCNVRSSRSSLVPRSKKDQGTRLFCRMRELSKSRKEAKKEQKRLFCRMTKLLKSRGNDTSRNLLSVEQAQMPALHNLVYSEAAKSWNVLFALLWNVLISRLSEQDTPGQTFEIKSSVSQTHFGWLEDSITGAL